MTQDQCLENSHQAKSLSTNAQVSDEPNNSKNTVVSNGVNSVREFNADVNGQQNESSTDEVVVRNFDISADSSPTLNASTTQSGSLFVSKLSQRGTDNSVRITDENNKKTSDNIVFPVMTVIAHQNSSENIRDKKNNKISSETPEDIDEKNEINSDKYSVSGKLISQSGALKKNAYTRRNENKNTSETDQSEDPIERLNKLRASISNALSEVKGVLKQYSTEQTPETEHESTPSAKSSGDGPVRFRFVRKIRRRSTFNEEQDEVDEKNLADLSQTVPPQTQVMKSSSILNETGLEIGSDELDVQKQEKNSIQKHDKPSDFIEDKLIEKSDQHESSTSTSNIDNNLIENKASQNSESENKIASNLATNNNKENKILPNLLSDNKKLKSKTTVYKGRRASIAVADTILKEEPSVLNTLNSQRRLSDSMTLVKQPLRTSPKSKGKNNFVQKSQSKPVSITTDEVRNVKSTNVGLMMTNRTKIIENNNTNGESKQDKNNSSTLSKIENSESEKKCIEQQTCHNSENVDSLKSSNLVDKSIKYNQRSCQNSTTSINATSTVSEKADNVPNSSSKNVLTELHTNNEFVVIEKSDKMQVNISDKGKTESIAIQLSEESSNHATQLLDVVSPIVPAVSLKKKRKAKRKVVIRRLKRKLSKDDTFIQAHETPSELEICEKEIRETSPDEDISEIQENVPEQRKSCLKARQFEIGDIVMYAERYKKTQVKWKKAVVKERITSISYKLDIEGEEVAAHISYIKKYTDRKVNFGGKEYLEIDYAQIEEDEERERNYSIWNLV